MVHWAGVAGLSELNSSSCTETLGFAGKVLKHIEGELKNDLPENYAHSLYQ